MLNFCTLFDSGYLTRGLAMYESLKMHAKDFHLYVFVFDDKSLKILNQLNLEYMSVISLVEFEDAELLAVKDSRSRGEYCWTSTPSTIKFCLEKFNLDHCTYVDADLYFFNDPTVLITEMGDASVLITEHRYTPDYDQSATSGIYCVQFMTFKNDTNGMTVLNWWRSACLEWCYDRLEDGKFGDQKYLDDWTERFNGVHVLQNLGGGVAPWNVQQYDVAKLNTVFYHFHGVKLFHCGLVDFASYVLSHEVVTTLYRPYIFHLCSIVARYQLDDEARGMVSLSIDLRFIVRSLKRWVKGVYNVHRIKVFCE